MPKDTFIKLPLEKKEKVIKAAKKEFARVPFEKVSIQNMVEDAGIARGSFYQYFESKEDLLYCIMQEHTDEIYKRTEKTLIDTNGDIFAVFIQMYDDFVYECFDKEDIKLMKNIFDNIRTSDDTIFIKNMKLIKSKNIEDYYDLVNKEMLKIDNMKDFEIIVKMLIVITRKALASHFKYESKEQSRECYLKQIEFLKYGMLREEKKC